MGQLSDFTVRTGLSGKGVWSGTIRRDELQRCM